MSKVIVKRSHKILIWTILILSAKLVDSGAQKCFKCNSKLDENCLNLQVGDGVTCKDNEKCVTFIGKKKNLIILCN